VSETIIPFRGNLYYLLSRQVRLEMATKAWRERRLDKSFGHYEVNGREFVNPLAAFGPDIWHVEDVPADILPPWIAHTVDQLFGPLRKQDLYPITRDLLAFVRQLPDVAVSSLRRHQHVYRQAALRLAVRQVMAAHTGSSQSYWPSVCAILKEAEQILSGDRLTGRTRVREQAQAAYDAIQRDRECIDLLTAPWIAARAALFIATHVLTLSPEVVEAGRKATPVSGVYSPTDSLRGLIKRATEAHTGGAQPYWPHVYKILTMAAQVLCDGSLTEKAYIRAQAQAASEPIQRDIVRLQLPFHHWVTAQAGLQAAIYALAPSADVNAAAKTTGRASIAIEYAALCRGADWDTALRAVRRAYRSLARTLLDLHHLT
jgi:hypothetical protein